MYKKIYLEITNQCNLKCSFCIHNDRKVEYMEMNSFKVILSKLIGYTKYLYFHLLGEPLLHPLINEFIDEANSQGFMINITTNGYLINNLITTNVRQINISLHSFNPNNELSTKEYMDNIFKVVDQMNNTIISYRFWVNSPNNNQIIDLINQHYQSQIIFKEFKGNIKIKDKIYMSIDEEFIWPDIKHGLKINTGFCQAIKDQLGILVDGTVVPCCLDSKGDISLGNLYQQNLKQIIESEKYTKLKKNFHDNKREELLCQNCSYKQKYDI